jgi:hypothetical protein
MLPELQARRQLLAIEAASVPQMSDSSRSEVLRRYTSQLSGTKRAKSLHEALGGFARTTLVPVKK